MKFKIVNPLILFLCLTKLAFGQSVVEGNSDPNKIITKEEEKIAEEYIHQGLTNRTLEQECVGNEDACQGKEANVIGGSGDNIVSAVSKAYGVFALSGVGGKDKGKDGQEKQDYCGLLPPATETVSQTVLTAEQTKIKNTKATGEHSEQKESLFKAARNHKARAKSAKIQTIGWGATTGCYAATTASNMATGGSTSAMSFIKMGAAGFLTVFYNMKKKKHDEYEKTVLDIANKLPSPGQCNPVTDPHCYCSQIETMADPVYCLPELYKNNQTVIKNGNMVTCITGQQNSDLTCSCQSTNSCFDPTFKGFVGTDFQLGTNLQKSIPQEAKDLFNGQLKEGELDQLASKQFAIINDLIEKNKDKLPQDLLTGNNLNANERAQAKALADLGLHPLLASKIAKLPETDQSKKFKNAIGESLSFDTPAITKNKNGIQEINFGNSNSSAPNKKITSSNDNLFSNRKTASGKNDINVLRFAKKADEKGEIIYRSDDGNIFERISMRYKTSAWKIFFYD